MKRPGSSLPLVWSRWDVTGLIRQGVYQSWVRFGLCNLGTVDHQGWSTISVGKRKAVTYLDWSLRTLETKETFPEPGGPWTVMKLPGNSASHLSTLFSASCRSFQAPSPIVSSVLPVGEDDWKKESDDENFDRKATVSTVHD
jgi:hypothetical protein